MLSASEALRIGQLLEQAPAALIVGASAPTCGRLVVLAEVDGEVRTVTIDSSNRSAPEPATRAIGIRLRLELARLSKRCGLPAWSAPTRASRAADPVPSPAPYPPGVPIGDALLVAEQIRAGDVGLLQRTLDLADLSAAPPWLTELAWGGRGQFTVALRTPGALRVVDTLLAGPNGWGRLRVEDDRLWYEQTLAGALAATCERAAIALTRAGQRVDDERSA